jgi:hypothetical protein
MQYDGLRLPKALRGGQATGREGARQTRQGLGDGLRAADLHALREGACEWVVLCVVDTSRRSRDERWEAVVRAIQLVRCGLL